MLSISAPNLSRLVGFFTADKLIESAGGLVELAKLTPGSISQLGKTEMEYGYIYNSIIVQDYAPEYRKKMAKFVANKAALAIRCDAFQTTCNVKPMFLIFLRKFDL